MSKIVKAIVSTFVTVTLDASLFAMECPPAVQTADAPCVTADDPGNAHRSTSERMRIGTPCCEHPPPALPA